MHRVVALLLLGAAATAGAQPLRRLERNAAAADLARSRGQVADDHRDLRRFQATLNAFDGAVARRDAAGVRAALQSFVQQGRMEVAEQRRETLQAGNEAARSQREAWRDRNPRDRWNARDDRRDARAERRELAEEEAALAQLEQAASAEIAFGPQAGILVQARQAMLRFIELARVELARSRQEVREDRRELREDQRSLRRARGF